jgi:hypothetical protein
MSADPVLAPEAELDTRISAGDNRGAFNLAPAA